MLCHDKSMLNSAIELVGKNSFKYSVLKNTIIKNKTSSSHKGIQLKLTIKIR